MAKLVATLLLISLLLLASLLMLLAFLLMLLRSCDVPVASMLRLNQLLPMLLLPSAFLESKLLLWTLLLLASLLLLTPQLLLLLAFPDVPVVSCAAVDPAVADVLLLMSLKNITLGANLIWPDGPFKTIFESNVLIIGFHLQAEGSFSYCYIFRVFIKSQCCQSKSIGNLEAISSMSRSNF